ARVQVLLLDPGIGHPEGARIMDAPVRILSAPKSTLLLTRSEIAELMRLDDYLAAAERAFHSLADPGSAPPPMPLYIPVREGGFHAKGACLGADCDYVALKLHANFPSNPRRCDRP